VVLRRAGADALSLDTRLLTPSGWESVAAAVEDGVGLWAGCLPAGDESTSWADGGSDGVADGLTKAWQQVGLELPLLADLVVTPSCGLAGVSPARAVETLRAAVAVQRRLAVRAAG
jgi:hypothetical protein